MASILIIANPTSGRRKGVRMAEVVAAYLRRRDHEVAVRFTTTSRDAEQVALDACAGDDRPTCIVACGGDGTVQQVANALAGLEDSPGSSVPVMGLAPAGRCNDFARALGISDDPVAIAGTIADGEPRAIDLGRVNGRYFCTVATLGIDAEVTSFVDSMRMPLKGTMAYIYGALRVLAVYRPHEVRISGDVGVITQGVFLASSANTPSYGGAIPIAPGADPTDGRLDLCVIDAVSRIRSFALLPIVMLGRHQNRAGVRFIRTRELCIDAAEPLELWADGERIGSTPARIDVAPGALRVLLPSG